MVAWHHPGPQRPTQLTPQESKEMKNKGKLTNKTRLPFAVKLSHLMTRDKDGNLQWDADTVKTTTPNPQTQWGHNQKQKDQDK